MTLLFSVVIGNQTVVSRVTYQELIRTLRQRLGVRSSHNVPALTVQSERPPGYCDIIIETDNWVSNYSVRLRLRVDNLYLIGYLMRSGLWLEFNRLDGHHEIPNSEYLGFNCNYEHIQHRANQYLSETNIGLNVLETAVQVLDSSTNMQERARSLIVVLFMICEATRFIPVMEFFIRQGSNSPRIPVWMTELARRWSKYSSILFRADAYPKEKYMIPAEDVLHIPEPQERTIQTIADLVSILGLLLGLCFNQPKPSVSLRMTLMSQEQGQCFVGVPILEVYSVTINYITGQDTANIRGTISITNGQSTLTIYNRTKNNPEHIWGFQEIELTGPSRSLNAFGEVLITLHLILNDSGSTFIDKTIVWDAFNIGTTYDRRISIGLDSPQGSVTVHHAVLRNAVAADVTVTLSKSYEWTSEVYGRIYAYYDDWNDSKARSWLFKKGSTDYVSVGSGNNVPLSRSLVGVPLSSKSLSVKAELLDYDSLSADDVIVNQRFDFPIPDSLPSSSFQDSTTVDGNAVRVTINWSSGYT